MKKKLRVWKKKVSYVSRQKIANNRIRVRGRFISAKSNLNQENYDLITFPPSPPNMGPKNEINEYGWS